MRPILRFLSDDVIRQIVAEARGVLARLGVELRNPQARSLLADNGAQVDAADGRIRIPGVLIDRALASVPTSFRLYDVLGHETHNLSGYNLYFNPGSAALNVLDYNAGEIRRPDTRDYVRYAQVTNGLRNMAAQSTAFIPADVPEPISDSYRLFLSLLYCEKPVVTGTFTAESFRVMKDMQVVVRGSEAALHERPLTIFSCCPTAPLKWSDVTSQNVVDCARSMIPIELISMPLSGFMAPVTLVGTLVQHTAETLSGIVIGQMASPGSPVLYGGSPAIFDVRYETTPMGAVETMMVNCAYNEIGHHLKMPTQAYIGLSDSKLLDAQAGLESSMGVTLAALAGINSVSGPGMLDFESCQSLEKLVLDNELCGMALRMAQGIEPKEDFPSLPHFEELLRDKHLLIARHTRKHLKNEHYFPGPVIDRANRERWKAGGSLTLGARAHREVQRLIETCAPSRLPEGGKQELTRLMSEEAARYGMSRLPEQE